MVTCWHKQAASTITALTHSHKRKPSDSWIDWPVESRSINSYQSPTTNACWNRQSLRTPGPPQWNWHKSKTRSCWFFLNRCTVGSKIRKQPCKPADQRTTHHWSCGCRRPYQQYSTVSSCRASTIASSSPLSPPLRQQRLQLLAHSFPPLLSTLPSPWSDDQASSAMVDHDDSGVDRRLDVAELLWQQ